jgi:hypothetical protein
MNKNLFSRTLKMQVEETTATKEVRVRKKTEKVRESTKSR